MDTLSTIVFFTVIAGVTELYVAGMEPLQVLLARTIMIPIMVLTGRPYGLWRDRLFSRIRPHGRVAVLATDVFAFLTFQLPVYVATLIVAGADLTEIATAVGMAIIFMIIVSRPFGLYLEVMRRWTGATRTRG